MPKNIVKETLASVLFAIGAIVWMCTGEARWFYGAAVAGAVFNLSRDGYAWYTRRTKRK